MHNDMSRVLVRFLCALAVVTTIGCSAERPPDHPNVLFIVIDDLNDWVGPLGGHPQVQTPNLDRLAARGTTFLNAHVQAPLCNSSRSSFLTGLRPSTTGIYALNPWLRESEALRDRPTVLQTFNRMRRQRPTGTSRTIRCCPSR